MEPVLITGTWAFIVAKLSSVTETETESWHESTPSQPPMKTFQSSRPLLTQFAL